MTLRNVNPDMMMISQMQAGDIKGWERLKMIIKSMPGFYYSK